MKNSVERKGCRKPDQLRDVTVSFNVFGYSAGSVLLEIGNTKVLCSVSLQQNVPNFLKGKKTGWLTAEYAMLPTSSATRVPREASLMRRNGRSVEISRLIGRSLRSVVDLSLLGERTIFVDCDVLQADGGTRTACITGAFLALRVAVEYWLKNKIIKEDILTDSLAAISVGIVDGTPLLDIDFSEDSCADSDFNFVITRSNNIVELQGSSEGVMVSWKQFEQVRDLAIKGVQDLFTIGNTFFDKEILEIIDQNKDNRKNNKKTAPLFSLGNRQKNIET